MSGAGSGDASFASQPSSEYTVESSRWLTAESSRWPTATAMYGVDSSNEDDPEYIPSEENEEDDASTSDHNGYSIEEQNDEYVDGRRNEEEHFQLQLLGYEYHSQYENSDEEVWTPRDSEDELGYIHTVYRGRRFDAGSAIETIKFQVGMKFESASEFTTAVRNYAIWNGFNIRFIKSEARKVQVACDRDCPWRMYGSLDGMKESFVVKALNDDHTCSRAPRNIQANHKWIANHFLEKFRMDINWKVSDMMREIQDKFGIIVSRNVCYKARAVARRMLQGTLTEHYHLLHAYVAELRNVSRGTFKMELADWTENSATFKRLYICFDSLAQGFRGGCRPVIGLDGCFLKTVTKGQLLSAVGMDGNNQMFPIAWAVVEGENRESWTWFIELLMQDLHIIDGTGWTIISYQQKGLETAVAYLIPNAEHRNCARHIYANWKKKGHSTEQLKVLFWKAVKCTMHAGFSEIMGHMSTVNPQAAQDFQDVGIMKFCRAYISEWPKSDVIDNNICECFNNYILCARSRPIIDMLEEIRIAIMKRIMKKRALCSKVYDDLCPRLGAVIAKNKLVSRRCIVVHAGEYRFEVTMLADRFVVDLNAQTSTCRYFNIRGIPCPHAIACIQWTRQDPADFVSHWFKKETYEAAYSSGIPAMDGRNMWNADVRVLVFPPIVRKQPGRPKQKRQVHISERDLTGQRLPKKGVPQTCSICHQFGHNKRSCP